MIREWSGKLVLQVSVVWACVVVMLIGMGDLVRMKFGPGRVMRVYVAFAGSLIGLATGFAIGDIVSCAWLYPDDGLCSILPVFVTGPIGLLIGLAVGLLIGRIWRPVGGDVGPSDILSPTPPARRPIPRRFRPPSRRKDRRPR